MSSKQTNARKNLTIRNKLVLTCLVLLLAPIAILGSIIYQTSAEENNLLIEKNLKNAVHMAVELTSFYEQAAKSGGLTEQQAQEQVKELLLGPQKEGLRPVNSSIDLGEHGYFFILNEQGDLLAHPLLEGQNIADKQTSDGFYYIQDMITKAKAGGGFTTYSWPLPDSTKEAPKITYAGLSPSWGWIIGAGSYYEDYNSGQVRILKTILLTLAVCYVAGAVILTLFSLHISRPIMGLARQAKQFAAGDLSSYELKIRNKDEIGELFVSFQTMHANLKTLAQGLLTSSDSLSAASYQLSAATTETTSASTQIAEAVQTVAGTNEAQAQSIRESSRAMEEMALGIQRIAATSLSVYETSIAARQQAEKGHRLIHYSTEQMNAISATVVELVGMMHKLENRSNQIGEIVQVMSEISSQTNLLALNASIEAARAGEHGRGFAVVASEVKKLAERSNLSASQITELIDSIRHDIETAAAAMAKSEHEVEEGVQSIRLTGDTFAHILAAARSIVEQAQESSGAAEQMSASSQQIAASLQELERMATRSSGMAQTISASTEEQIAAMEEISASAESLQSMSQDMQQLARRFKL
ncbi:methyl-accepting chemotaxis protein [Paenibacillus puerhi]|uniref:methyl-accepting chemotaxis protein n=1 Tax=Paenibacillus puerhi TaxID=2692622 RepID=UPI00135A2911|nr:methyl-accepting chemotaxis protein [Paenibacillus puerhi]